MPNILIVEDNDVTAKFLESLLVQKGYQVKTLGDGTNISNEVKRFLPQLILMDIVLPNADGADVVEELQREEEFKDIPVIFLSAIIEQDDHKKNVISIHKRDYPALSKMVTTTELLETIKKSLRSRY